MSVRIVMYNAPIEARGWVTSHETFVTTLLSPPVRSNTRCFYPPQRAPLRHFRISATPSPGNRDLLFVSTARFCLFSFWKTISYQWNSIEYTAMVYSPVDGCLGCFSLSIITSKVTAHVHVQVLRQTHVSTSPRKIPWSGMRAARSPGECMFTFIRECQPAFQNHLASPPAAGGSSGRSVSFSAFGIVRL